MSRWISDLGPALESRQQDNLYRQRLTLDTAQGPLVQLQGREYLNFSSNDYLGLANHPEVISAFQSAAQQYGVGAGASHLVVGHQQVHEALECALASFVDRERALLFSSGYMANLGIFKALLGKDDVIIQDKLNHASLIDGGISSGGQFLRYRHNDLDHLEQLLSKPAIADQKIRKILAVDGVFSMDGDIAPLDSLADICDSHNIALMVDDAHGFGVVGERGAGCSEHFSLDQQRLPIVMGTLGKAFGVAGAFVAGSHEMIETLIQYSRTYIYTTALPPACAAAALQSLNIIKTQPQRGEHLQALIGYFRAAVNDLNFDVLPSSTAIQPLIVGDSKKALALSQALMDAGILVSAIRPPTVPAGTARLRITLTAAHSFAHIDQLINVLRQHQSRP
jgi:8-amino-7-oxononanoate synthase